MNIPFVDLKTQYHEIRNEIHVAMEEVLSNAAYILGKPVKRFEEMFADAHDVEHCVGLSSGTDGNHLSLWALGIHDGDEVVIPANTFVATAWGATLCGARPVFVDCEPDSYNMDPSRVADAISSKTKAIVPVHLYGQAANMNPIAELAATRGLFLVEDCAQAHLATYNGKKVGGFGAAASFSFYPGKNLGAYGEAGAVVTNDADLARRFRLHREHGSLEKYRHEVLGHNYRMEALQGAVLGVKMKYLAKWTDQRRKVAQIYGDGLSGIGDIVLPCEMPYAHHVYHLYVIRTSRRDQLQEFLQKAGVATGLHYPIPLHLQPCFRDLGYRKGDFPVAEQLAETCLSLPMYPEISESQLSYAIERIKTFFM